MVYRSKWTGLPADRVVSELLTLHSRYRMDEVLFLDDDLFASLKRIRELADAFIGAAVPFVWKGTARADELCRLPEDFFPRLRQAGCKRINVGAESGSQKVLDQIKKEYQVDEILTAAERAARAGISLSYSFIAGFPGETARDFQSTIDVLKAIRSKGSAIEASIYFYSRIRARSWSRSLSETDCDCRKSWSNGKTSISKEHGLAGTIDGWFIVSEI